MSLLELSAVELRRRIGAKQVSPVELMDACIAQIEALNPAINAISATDFDRARQSARQAEQAVMSGDALGPLHGLPLGVKDLQNTEGLLTTFGNVQYRGNIPKADDTLIARLRDAGAIVTAKTNVPDMGAGANTRNPVWGATGNPFNPELNAGGSSGGSAAALATDMLPICTGSDTGGSLRIPAAICGVVGFRPSPGVVPNNARPLGWSAISVLGPMGRTVADTALLMGSSLGLHPHDPLSIDVDPKQFWPLTDLDLSNLRVGYTEDFGTCAVDEGIRRVFRDRVKALSTHVASMRSLDLNFENGHRCFDILRAESFVAAFADTYRNSPEKLGPNVRANVEMSATISLADRAWAHLEQTRLNRQIQDAFKDVDLILSPVTPVSPFAWTSLYAQEVEGKKMQNYYEWLSLTYMVTLATNPAVSLPCGVDEKGMPFGLQMIAPLRHDGRLMRMAHAVEQAFNLNAKYARPKPDLEKLTTPHPELKSIVTHPPIFTSGGNQDGQQIQTAV